MRTHSTEIFTEDDEPIGEAFLKPWAWLGALAVMVVMAGAQVEDRRAEWAQSQALEQAQLDAKRAERRARAAQEMCNADHGPQALAVWVSEDTVECVNPRGRRLSRSDFHEVVHAPR